jgi:Flp pilus assembly protein TadG
MWTQMKRKREAGQLVIALALSMLILCGFAALATDVGSFFRAKRIIQTAVDNAAIAGSAELSYADVATAAEADAASNGVASCTNTTNSATVPAPVSPATCSIVVNNPPMNGPHTCTNDATNCSQYVEVMASQNQPTFFMNLFGWNIMPVSARAVAYPGNGANAGCVYALDPNSADTDISANDHATSFSMPNCSMYADSPGSAAVNAKTGSISARDIGIVGSYTSQGSGSVSASDALITGMQPAVADPLLYLQNSAPTLPANANTCSGASSGTLAPGFYCGINGTSTLTPGLYTIGKSGINLGGNSSITCPTCVAGTANGVTLYFSSGSSGIYLGGNTHVGTNAIPLSAPVCPTTVCSNGAINQVVLWGAGTGGMSGQGTPDFNVNGILYFPNAAITMWGSAGGGVADVAIVAWQIAFGGDVQVLGIPISGGIFPIKVATLAE